MIDDYEQYDKAEPYLWCVVNHCSRCDGDDDDGSESGSGDDNGDCPTASVGLYSNTTCVSATYNYLVSNAREHDPPAHYTTQYTCTTTPPCRCRGT